MVYFLIYVYRCCFLNLAVILNCICPLLEHLILNIYWSQTLMYKSAKNELTYCYT